MIEIEHKEPHPQPIQLQLTQRDFGTAETPDWHYRVRCICGAVSAIFPKSELEKHWSSDRGTTFTVPCYHNKADKTLDNFIEKSGEMIRNSPLFGGGEI